MSHILSMLIREWVHILTICTHIVFRIGYSMISDAEKKGLISPGKVKLYETKFYCFLNLRFITYVIG